MPNYGFKIDREDKSHATNHAGEDSPRKPFNNRDIKRLRCNWPTLATFQVARSWFAQIIHHALRKQTSAHGLRALVRDRLFPTTSVFTAGYPMRFSFLSISLLLAVVPAYAEAPVLASDSPVIYLADNLDEPEKLGWCIDTRGRGFAKTLHAHSCKSAGRDARDTQFSHDVKRGWIQSVAFPEYCMALSGRKSSETDFRLRKCLPDDPRQKFVYDEASMEIRIGGDTSECVVVSRESRSAGPFRARDLLQAECGSVGKGFRQWIVLN